MNFLLNSRLKKKKRKSKKSKKSKKPIKGTEDTGDEVPYNPGNDQRVYPQGLSTRWRDSRMNSSTDAFIHEMPPQTLPPMIMKVPPNVAVRCNNEG